LFKQTWKEVCNYSHKPKWAIVPLSMGLGFFTFPLSIPTIRDNQYNCQEFPCIVDCVEEAIHMPFSITPNEGPPTVHLQIPWAAG